jgi:recombination protein RecA
MATKKKQTSTTFSPKLEEVQSRSIATNKAVAVGKTGEAKAPGAVSGSIAEKTASFVAKLQKMGVKGDVDRVLEFISSGNWIIDRLIGDGKGNGGAGGVPRGAITEVFGNESCGKSTLAFHLIKEVQASGGLAVYVDHERTFTLQKEYVRRLGVEIDDINKFILIEPDNYEQGNSLMGQAIIELKPAIVVIDSLAAAVPKDAMNSDPEDPVRMGLHAQLTSTILPRFAKFIKHSNTALVILNQTRKNIKKSQYDVGPDETTAGGNAIKFYTSLRIEMQTKAKESQNIVSNLTGAEAKKVLNQAVKVTVIKNKIDQPFMSSLIYLTFGKGIDGLRSLLEAGVNKKVIKEVSGSWLEYVSLSDPSKSWKRNGVQQTMKFLNENPAIVCDMLPYLIPTVDVEEAKRAIDEGEVLAEDLPQVVDLTAVTGKKSTLTPEEEEMLKELKESQAKVSPAAKAKVSLKDL